MARIEIPKPISTYRDLGTVELAKLARDQYIHGYSAADDFSNKVRQMQSLEKDDYLKNQISQKYTGMLESWAGRRDYETLGMAINKGATGFINEYSPIAQSVTNRQDYQKRLQDAYDKGDINANTFQERLAQSDYGYQGIQYDENGVFDPNSVYQGRQFYKDVDITEKVTDYMTNIKPFIRENMGTDIPYNEDFEITNTRGDRGEIKYWVKTKSKTSQIPDELIQMAVNEVMSDPDVQASLAQEIDLNTYKYAEINPITKQPYAMDEINKLIEGGHIKEEDFIDQNGKSLLESMGPLAVYQNLMYQDAVNRETQLAIGTFGGVRTSGSGSTTKYDAVWTANNKNQSNIQKKIGDPSNDLSYTATVEIVPISISYKDALNDRSNGVNLIKGNLSLVTGQMNVDPDKIQYDANGNEIPQKGQGLNLDDMSDEMIVGNAQAQLVAYNTMFQLANTPTLKYNDWKNSGMGPTPKTDDNGNIIEGEEEFANRRWENYLQYAESTENTRKRGNDHLNIIAGVNNLDIDNYHLTMKAMGSQVQLWSVTDQKIRTPLLELSVGDYTNLSYEQYKKRKGEQLNGTIFKGVGGDDWIQSGQLQLFTLNNPWFIDNVDVHFTGRDVVNVYNQHNPDNQIETVLDLAYLDISEGSMGGPPSQAMFSLASGIYKHIMKRDFGKNPEDINNLAIAFDARGEGIQDILTNISDLLVTERKKIDNIFADKFSSTPIPIESAVMTNFGANYATDGYVNNALKDFFKDGVFPSNLMVQEANGNTNLGHGVGVVNSAAAEWQRGASHEIGEYKIMTDQIGVLNIEVGGDALLYLPVKVTGGSDDSTKPNYNPYKGKTLSFMAKASQINIPALSTYLNSAEFEVNKKWNLGIQQRLSVYIPPEYSNVTFNYDDNKVIIDGEIHTKEKGLSILTENILKYRRFMQ